MGFHISSVTMLTWSSGPVRASTRPSVVVHITQDDLQVPKLVVCNISRFLGTLRSLLSISIPSGREGALRQTSTADSRAMFFSNRFRKNPPTPTLVYCERHGPLVSPRAFCISNHRRICRQSESAGYGLSSGTIWAGVQTAILVGLRPGSRPVLVFCVAHSRSSTRAIVAYIRRSPSSVSLGASRPRGEH